MKGRGLVVRVGESHECNVTHLHVSDLQHGGSKAAQVNKQHRVALPEALSTIVTFKRTQILNVTPYTCDTTRIIYLIIPTDEKDLNSSHHGLSYFHLNNILVDVVSIILTWHTVIDVILTQVVLTRNTHTHTYIYMMSSHHIWL